jgi:hypothetical protein
MPFSLLADIVFVIHLLFIMFVVGGGLLVLSDRKWAWLHLPAALWGALVELTGWVCPLTPLENWLRRQGGATADTSDFVSRYLVALIYPEGMTRQEQILLGIAVLIINAGIYGRLVIRCRRHRRKDNPDGPTISLPDER